MLPQGVTVKGSKGNRESDIIQQQFTKRRLFMMGTIDQKMSMDFISAMLVLAEQHKDAEIFTDSQGGKVSAGLMIYDVLSSYKYKITMYCKL